MDGGERLECVYSGSDAEALNVEANGTVRRIPKLSVLRVFHAEKPDSYVDGMATGLGVGLIGRVLLLGLPMWAHTGRGRDVLRVDTDGVIADGLGGEGNRIGLQQEHLLIGKSRRGDILADSRRDQQRADPGAQFAQERRQQLSPRSTAFRTSRFASRDGQDQVIGRVASMLQSRTPAPPSRHRPWLSPNRRMPGPIPSEAGQ